MKLFAVPVDNVITGEQSCVPVECVYRHEAQGLALAEMQRRGWSVVLLGTPRELKQ